MQHIHFTKVIQSYSMISKQYMKNDYMNNDFNKGFIALTATMTVVAVVLTFSFIVLSSAYIFSDSVFRRELRIQTRLNLISCLTYSKYLFANSYFINGDISIGELGCTLTVSNDFVGNLIVSATSTLSGISSYTKKSFHNDGYVVEEVDL